MNPKFILLLLAAILFMISCWLFFWPIIECIYATSLTPLLTDSYKFILFCFGGFIFIIGFALGVKVVI